MAIVARGHTSCALCGKPVEASDDVVATSHFVRSRFDRFHAYSDVPFHRACFLRWPARSAFVARFNELAARRTTRDAMRQMRDDGLVSSQPAVPVRPHAPTIPREHGHPYIAWPLLTRERRPGIHVAVAPPEPLPDARLVISMELPAQADRLSALAPGDMFVGPIEYARAMAATGDHALPLRMLAEAPPDFEHTPDAPGADAVHIEAGQHGRGGIPLARSAGYAIMVGSRWGGALIRAWAIRA